MQIATVGQNRPADKEPLIIVAKQRVLIAQTKLDPQILRRSRDTQRPKGRALAGWGNPLKRQAGGRSQAAAALIAGLTQAQTIVDVAGK
jgi:hypothetical protein